MSKDNNRKRPRDKIDPIEEEKKKLLREQQWKKDFSAPSHAFNHSETGPFETPIKRGRREPSSSGQPNNGGSSASKRKKPAPAPSSPGGKVVGNNAGKGRTPS